MGPLAPHRDREVRAVGAGNSDGPRDLAQVAPTGVCRLGLAVTSLHRCRGVGRVLLHTMGSHRWRSQGWGPPCPQRGSSWSLISAWRSLGQEPVEGVCSSVISKKKMNPQLKMFPRARPLARGPVLSGLVPPCATLGAHLCDRGLHLHPAM